MYLFHQYLKSIKIKIHTVSYITMYLLINRGHHPTEHVRNKALSYEVTRAFSHDRQGMIRFNGYELLLILINKR